MYYYDSCTVNEIFYNEKGNITEQYICNYNLAGHCYSKTYSNGVLSYETEYEPFGFSGIKDVSKLNAYCQDRKAIPIKTIIFDRKGNKISEDRIDPNTLYEK